MIPSYPRPSCSTPPQLLAGQLRNPLRSVGGPHLWAGVATVTVLFRPSRALLCRCAGPRGEMLGRAGRPATLTEGQVRAALAKEGQKAPVA